MDSKFMNNAYVLGEIRDKDLQSLGSGENERENARIKVNIASQNGFVNMQMNNPKKADKNYCEKLYSKIEQGDIIEISGSLEEFEYNDTLRRNVSPYISAKRGYGDNVKVYDNNSDKDFKANARLAGDIINKEEFVTDEKETGYTFTLLYFSLYNVETGKNDLSRREVLLNSIKNFGDYAKKTGRDIDFNKLSDLKDDIELLEDNDLTSIVNIYKEFKELFNPLLFNISEYTITAKGEQAEEMESVEVNDNITVGVYLVNNVVIDEFGFANGSENILEVGKFKGINESLNNGVNEIDNADW